MSLSQPNPRPTPRPTIAVNDLTLDAFCPISREPDYKKCAVRVERLG